MYSLFKARNIYRYSFLCKDVVKAYSNLSQKQQAELSTPELATSFKTVDDIPGPKSYPIIGSLLQLKKFGGDLDFNNYTDLCLKLQEKYGDIVRFRFLGFDQIFVFDPEHIKKVFQADGDLPIRPDVLPLRLYTDSRKRAESLAISQNEAWRKLRSASNPIAARPQNVHLFLPKQNEILDQFISIITEKFQNKDSLILTGFENNLKLLTLELISVVAFDQPLNCLDERNRSPKINELIKAVDDFFFYFAILLHSTPIYKYYPTKSWKKFAESLDVLYEATNEYVGKAYEDLKSKSDEFKQDMTSKTILQQYLLSMDKHHLSYDDILALTSDILFGAIDTAATTIHYLLYELGRNPDIQETLYEEIRSNLALNESLSGEKLAKMPFLKATVKETFRVHPLFPGNIRVLKKDLMLGDYKISKGTPINMGHPYIQASDRFFKNASKFNPMRWLKAGESYEAIHPYASLPFGFGPRQCIGRRIAEQEIYLTTSKIINNFKIEYIGEKIGYATKFVLTPNKPLNLKLLKRN